jgi:carbonic anhydrase/acetyltransferase-like protein (isoleucine patch superfamily)
MLRRVRGNTPHVAPSAFVSEQAYLVGDVTVGERSSVWPFVCLRGDGGSTTVGEESNVQEFSMLHGAHVGDRVTIGHNVVVDYAEIHNDTLVGMQSAVLRDAVVESNCIVAAGSVVLQDQTVPEGHMAYGTPAQTKPLTDAQLAEIERTQEHYVELSRSYKSEGDLERNRDPSG